MTGRPSQWQNSNLITLSAARPTLIMLVHPQCPCSRASLYELDRLAALCPGKAAISVLVLEPSGYSPAWAKSNLWHLAAEIPGVTVRLDKHGEMARHLGASTSGDTLLYAPDGRLLYQGGLTGARGHEGDNAGLMAVVDLLRGHEKNSLLKTAKQEPVYGCPMTADRQSAAAGEPIWLP